MGSWGTGPFDNDDARGFVNDLVELPAVEARATLEAALRTVADPDGDLGVIEVNEAIAAATMVAGLVEDALPEDDYAIERWADVEKPPTLDDDLAQLALAVLDRVGDPDDNEWYQVKDETDELEDALAALEPYREALS
jgi:hypothetical protein